MDTQPVLLVIDDELGPRESLRFLFKDQYDVTCVESVDQAIQALQQITPDCIITDIKMPGKTGLDGLREIRTIDQDVSIIMLTGFGSLETAQQAIRHGASDYVKKPFDAAEMRAVVADHMQKTQFKRRQHTAYKNLQALNEQLQTELEQKEHLAALGQASSEFVHDLRNPLTVICGYVSLLMGQIQKTSAESADGSQQKITLEYLDHLEKSVQRCQEMSQTWRDISKQDIDAMESVQVEEVVHEVAVMLCPIAAEHKSAIRANIITPNVTVRGNSLQLFRALQNLCSNALQAIPPDGTGTVTMQLTADEQTVTVTVTDNGPGIPPEKLESVFTPYVSTRKSDGGMGLGLFITRKIIEAHKGTILLQNQPKGGLCATVTLRRA